MDWSGLRRKAGSVTWPSGVFPTSGGRAVGQGDPKPTPRQRTALGPAAGGMGVRSPAAHSFGACRNSLLLLESRQALSELVENRGIDAVLAAAALAAAVASIGIVGADALWLVALGGHV